MKALYNQNLEKFTRNGCTVYTLLNITRMQWGITVDNKYIIDVLQAAQKDKMWNESW
jgi:hypothetical protein